jgi:hypothetical protein
MSQGEFGRKYTDLADRRTKEKTRRKTKMRLSTYGINSEEPDGVPGRHTKPTRRMTVLNTNRVYLRSMLLRSIACHAPQALNGWPTE